MPVYMLLLIGKKLVDNYKILLLNKTIMKLSKSILYGSLIYFIFFLAYLEINPSITNVWYRIGVDGARHINLPSLWNFITKPFSMIELWYPQNWDINYFVGAIILSIAIYYFI
jgi:hypothetical protein